MKIKKASGWIVRNSANQILLLKNRKRQDWGVPKGHIENGENDMEAAYRELYEETGLKPSHIFPDPDFSTSLTYYPISSKGMKYQKTTTYFSALLNKPQPIKLSHEHDEFLWAHWPRVQSRISYQSLRQLIFKALKHKL